MQRLDFLDIARGLGVLLVVASHGGVLRGPAAPWIYEFYMPLFFVVSGYLCGRLGQLATGADCLRRVKRVAGSYLGGSAVLFAVWFLLYPLRERDFSQVDRAVFSILYGRTADPADPFLADLCWTGPMWFLTLLCTSQLLLYVLLRLDDGTLLRRALLVAALLGAASVLRAAPVLLPWCIDTAPAAALLMLAACWMGRCRLLEDLTPCRAVLLAAVAAVPYLLLHDTYDLHLRGYGRLSGVWGVLAFLLAGFGGSVLFLLLCRLLARCVPLCRALTAVGRATLPILIWHTVLLWAVDGVFLRLPDFPLAGAVRAAVVVIVVPALCLVPGRLRKACENRMKM